MKNAKYFLVLIWLSILVTSLFPAILVQGLTAEKWRGTSNLNTTLSRSLNDVTNVFGSNLNETILPLVIAHANISLNSNPPILTPPKTFLGIGRGIEERSKEISSNSKIDRGQPILEWNLRLVQNNTYEYIPLYWITPLLVNGKVMWLEAVNGSDPSYNWQMRYTGENFPSLTEKEAIELIYRELNYTPCIGEGRLVYACWQLFWAFPVQSLNGMVTDDIFVKISTEESVNGQISSLSTEDIVLTKEEMISKLAALNSSSSWGGSPPSSYTSMVGQVPYFLQGNTPWCAVFSLKEIFWYWGREDISEFDIANHFGGAPNGLFPYQVEEAFSHWGFQFHWHGDGKSIWDSGTSYTADDIKADVSMGWPTIIGVRHDLSVDHADHAVTVVGYNESHVCIHDTAPHLGFPGYDIWLSYNTLEQHWNVPSNDWYYIIPHTHMHCICVGYPGDQQYAHCSMALDGLPSEVDYGQTYQLQLALAEDGSDAGSSEYSWAQGVFLRLVGAELVSASTGGFKSYQAYDEAGNSVPIAGAKIIEFYSDYSLHSATIYAYATIRATSSVIVKYRGWITDEDDMTHRTELTHTIHDDRPAPWTMNNAELVIDRKPNDVINSRANFLDYPTFEKQAPLKGVASSTISVSVNPSQIFLGGGTTISGAISSSVPGDLSGTVYLQYSTDNTNWNNIGSISSDSSGAYSYWWTPSSTGTFYVRSYWNGNSEYGGAVSGSFYPFEVKPSGGNLDDHCMCKNVQPEDPWDPIERTNTFFTDDYAAFSWVKFVNIYSPSHTIHWDWYDPDGSFIDDYTWTIPDPGEGYYYPWYKASCYLPIDGYQAWYASRLGRSFRTEVYYDGSWVVTETWQVIKHGSSISVSLSSNTITYGQSVTVSSQLSPSFSDGTTTLKYSTDEVNWNNIASGTPSNGHYSSTWTPPAATTYYVRATWSGNLNYYGSMSSTQTLTVNRASTSLTTSLSSATITYSSSVTITASMSPALQGKSVTIQYSLDGSTWYYLGSGTTNSAGQYSYSWTPDAGVYYLRSTWSGDTNYYGATSTSQQLTVNKASTSTSCSLSSNSIKYGQSVDVTGTVNVPVNTGTMTLEYSFDESTWDLISAGTPFSGSHSYTWTPPSVGTFYVRAVWSGDSNYLGSTSSSQSLTVQPAEEWVPYVPTGEQTEIEITTEAGITYVKVTMTFPDIGYRVTDWGIVSRTGNEFSADAKVERWTGVSTPVITELSYTYELGSLEAGTYMFIFKAWSEIVKSVEFTPWVQYVPTPEETEIDIWTEAGITYANVSLTLTGAEYRVQDWGTALRTNNEFVVDAKVEQLPIPISLITTLSHMYELGNLPPDTYSFTFMAWGNLVESKEFTIKKPTLAVDPANITVNLHTTFEVNVTIANVTDLYAYEFWMYYNNTILEGLDVYLPEGHFLTPENPSNIFIAGCEIHQEEGYVHVGVTLMGEPGKDGNGVLVTIRFNSTETGETNLHLDGCVLADSGGNLMEFEVIHGYVTITLGIQMVISVEDQPYAKKVLVNVTVWSNQDYTNASIQADFLWDDTLIGQVSNFTDLYIGSNTFNLTWDSLNAPISVIGENVRVSVTIKSSEDSMLFSGEATFILIQSDKKLLWDRLTELIQAWPKASHEERDELWDKIAKIVTLYPTAP